MTNAINNLFSSISSHYNTQTNQAWWMKETSESLVQGPWQIFSEQCDTKVSLCLEGIADRMRQDMATETADYLSGHEGLASDYVIAIIDDPIQGREARVYRRSELLEAIPESKRADVAAYLEKDSLLYADSGGYLPETPDDEELQGLAGVVQGFLDRNDKVLDTLANGGVTPFLAG